MKPVARRTLVLALTLALASCGAKVAPTQPFDTQVSVPIGGTATLAGGSVGVRFDAVPEDSRCPGDALCISPGRAVVDVTLLLDDRAVALRLSTEPSGSKAVADGITVELVQLDPYPFASRPHQPGDYKLTLRLVG